MQKEIPTGWIAGVIGVLAVVLIVVGFFVFYDKPPTKEVNKVGRDQLKPRPETQAPPDWVIQKLKGGGSQ